MLFRSDLDEGGGQYFILKNGQVFDQVGVNFSRVQGKFPKNFRSKIPGANENPNYWASGISVVAHMKNPKVPAVHFNTRFITTSKEWFGGGIDATPAFKDENERKKIHQKLREICEDNGKNYNKYKKWCDEYFYLPHRNEPRGIGGIFFDYKKDNFEKDFKFVRDVGVTFQFIFQKIIKKKMRSKWTSKDKEMQYIKRGR